MASGEVYTSITDFSLKGIMPVNFTRYYNSKGTLLRGFGYQWSNSFDTRVMSLSNNLYKILNPDASIYYYNNTNLDNDTNGDIVYEADIPKGVTNWLIKHQDGTFTRESKDGAKEEFNTAGYLIAMVDRNGNRVTFTRDTSNRLTKITDAAGREIIITNAPGKINSITLPDGKQYTYTFLTSSGYLGTVTYPDGSKLKYEYIYISAVASYRLTGIKNENGKYIEKHTYDSQSNITSVKDAMLRTTTYTYDYRNRPVTITHPDATQTIFTYDNNGNITGAANQNMSYAISYDALNRITAIVDSLNRNVSYTYDTSSNRLSMASPAGTTAYVYNTLNQPISETNPLNKTFTFSYNSLGQRTGLNYPNGVTTTYTYDAINRLVNMLAQNTVPSTINTYAYTHDNKGNRTGMTDTTGTHNYTYDEILQACAGNTSRTSYGAVQL